MYEIREEKKKIRSKCRLLRADIEKTNKSELDTRICEAFTSLVSYRYADTLLAYYPAKGEIDVRPIIEKALLQGKKVALPLCYEEEGKMDFFYINSLDELEEGKYGIPAPKKDAELFLPCKEKNSSLMMVPALAFDKKGFRLGYGKGFYDRYISRFGGVLAGFIYSGLVLDSVPRGRFDMSVDYLVTDKGVKIIEKL
ncbi:MAG: 5-formyltetrahydrofolate cyclo-ligase [Clostridia bacterium]|nr:5-formyltetrahydrofolate cyclo-ligase [Clostridia bacterium]